MPLPADQHPRDDGLHFNVDWERTLQLHQVHRHLWKRFASRARVRHLVLSVLGKRRHERRSLHRHGVHGVSG